MGASINCDFCAVEEAMAMYTSLTDGSVVAVGPSCAEAFVVGLARSLGLVALPTDVVPVEMGGTLELPGVGDVLMQGNDEPAPLKSPVREEAPKPRKRGRRAQAGTEQPEESTTDEPADATDAATGAAQGGTPVEPEAEQVSV